MKKHVLKIAAALVAAVMLVSAFSGCGLNRSEEIVVRMKDEDIYMDEVKLYIYQSQLEMEDAYSIYIQYLYSDAKAFWDAEVSQNSGTTYWEYNLTRAISQLYQVKVLSKEAKKAGVTLTEEEQASVDAAYTSFTKSYGNMIRKSGASADTVRRFITENALANKYYGIMTEGYATDYTDEEVRGKRFYGVYIQALTVKPAPDEDEDEGEDTPAESAAPTESAAPEESAAPTESAAPEESAAPTESVAPTEAPEEEKFTDEEQQANLDAAMKKAEALIKEGKTPSEVTEEFKDDMTVTAANISSRVVTKATSQDSTYPYYEKAWGMSKGDTLSFIQDDANGVKTAYILYMEDDDDQDSKASSIDSLYLSRRAQIFKEKYTELTSGAYRKFDVYTTTIGTVVYSSDPLTGTPAAPTIPPSTSAPTTAAPTTAPSTAPADASTEAGTEAGTDAGSTAAAE
ncbi:MAG: hypothetical protein J6U26_04775 [Lachnospiraceae bacterium]|nr:hypothetical protein [Lachnospiraceae bacterium]